MSRRLLLLLIACGAVFLLEHARPQAQSGNLCQCYGTIQGYILPLADPVCKQVTVNVASVQNSSFQCNNWCKAQAIGIGPSACGVPNSGRPECDMNVVQNWHGEPITWIYYQSFGDPIGGEHTVHGTCSY